MKTVIQTNLYHIQLIEKIGRSYLDNKIYSGNKVNQPERNARYYKLPFIGRFSGQIQEKLDALIKKYCKSVSVNVVFTSFKIGQSFLNKDPVPSSLKSNVVYQCKCAGCSACYIGETTRHISSRIEEHLKTDKQSHIYKHLQNNLNCFNECNNKCFSILDSIRTKILLKLKEGMYIGWGNPDLNKQIKYASSTLTV